MFFKDYRGAFNAACEQAAMRGREVGLEKVDNPIDGKGYRVISLPKPENRSGLELRCQVVAPGEPRMA